MFGETKPFSCRTQLLTDVIKQIDQTKLNKNLQIQL